MKWNVTTSGEYGEAVQCTLCGQMIPDEVGCDFIYTPHAGDDFDLIVKLFGVESPAEVSVCEECVDGECQRPNVRLRKKLAEHEAWLGEFGGSPGFSSRSPNPNRFGRRLRFRCALLSRYVPDTS